MRARRAVALMPLLVACGVAGCSSGAGPAPRVSDVLNCGRIVAPAGSHGGPLTAGRAVAQLAALRRSGGAAGLHAGKPDGAALRTLDTVAVELIGYSGNKLSDDAEAFAVAELNYRPSGRPVDASYARPLDKAITALEHDCPPGRGRARPVPAGT